MHGFRADKRRLDGLQWGRACEDADSYRTRILAAPSATCFNGAAPVRTRIDTLDDLLDRVVIASMGPRL